MQSPLKLKPYEIPDTLPEAKALCQQMSKQMERMHANHLAQVAWLKQQYKIAMKEARPDFVTGESLKELFDESEVIADPESDCNLGEKEPESNKKKKRRKKKQAIPDNAPRTIVEHDLDEEQKKCAEDGCDLAPMGYDTRLELKYIRAKFEVIEHRYPNYSCQTCAESNIHSPLSEERLRRDRQQLCRKCDPPICSRPPQLDVYLQ